MLEPMYRTQERRKALTFSLRMNLELLDPVLQQSDTAWEGWREAGESQSLSQVCEYFY